MLEIWRVYNMMSFNYPCLWVFKQEPSKPILLFLLLFLLLSASPSSFPASPLTVALMTSWQHFSRHDLSKYTFSVEAKVPGRRGFRRLRSRRGEEHRNSGDDASGTVTWASRFQLRDSSDFSFQTMKEFLCVCENCSHTDTLSCQGSCWQLMWLWIPES